MDFAEYQIKAYSFARYPDEYRVSYPALALPEEAGEVCGKIAKAYRDCRGIIDRERKAAIAKELGDLLWQTAALATDLGLSLDDIARGNISKLEDRARRDVISGEGDER